VYYFFFLDSHLEGQSEEEFDRDISRMEKIILISSAKLAPQLARDLRQNQTGAEKMLWNKLRNRRFNNLKFLRQHPIYYKFDNQRKFFIADFYCHEIKLVIEIDGKIHNKQKEYDQLRTKIIKLKKINVIRFTNEEIYHNINFILKKLNKYRQVLINIPLPYE